VGPGPVVIPRLAPCGAATGCYLEV